MRFSIVLEALGTALRMVLQETLARPPCPIQPVQTLIVSRRWGCRSCPTFNTFMADVAHLPDYNSVTRMCRFAPIGDVSLLCHHGCRAGRLGRPVRLRFR